MESKITYQFYDPGIHYEIVREWWKARNKIVVPEWALPKCGVVGFLDGEPAGATWLYFDSSTPVCFLAHAVSRPKLPLAQVTSMISGGMEILKQEAIRMGATVMSAYLPKGIARYLKKEGFVGDWRELINISTLLREDLCQ